MDLDIYNQVQEPDTAIARLLNTKVKRGESRVTRRKPYSDNARIGKVGTYKHRFSNYREQVLKALQDDSQVRSIEQTLGELDGFREKYQERLDTDKDDTQHISVRVSEIITALRNLSGYDADAIKDVIKYKVSMQPTEFLTGPLRNMLKYQNMPIPEYSINQYAAARYFEDMKKRLEYGKEMISGEEWFTDRYPLESDEILSGPYKGTQVDSYPGLSQRDFEKSIAAIAFYKARDMINFAAMVTSIKVPQAGLDVLLRRLGAINRNGHINMNVIMELK